MKVKEESEKVGLKLNIQKTKIMASGPITSWEIDGETVDTVSDFIFLGSKITVDGDGSHEIRGHLLLGRKPKQHIKKQRHHFANKGSVQFSHSVTSDSLQPHRRQPIRLPCPWDSPGKNAGMGCHFLLQCMKAKAQSCLTLRDPIDCSLPGSSVHGNFQARVLEWVAISFSMS